MSRLDSGCPGTIAGPEFPPFSKWSRESSCSPPSLESVWQAKQFLLSTGRTRDSKNSPVSCAGRRRARVSMATASLSCPGTILIGLYHISYLRMANGLRGNRSVSLESIDRPDSKELAESDMLAPTPERSECRLRILRALRRIPEAAIDARHLAGLGQPLWALSTAARGPRSRCFEIKCMPPFHLSEVYNIFR